MCAIEYYKIIFGHISDIWKRTVYSQDCFWKMHLGLVSMFWTMMCLMNTYLERLPSLYPSCLHTALAVYWLYVYLLQMLPCIPSYVISTLPAFDLPPTKRTRIAADRYSIYGTKKNNHSLLDWCVVQLDIMTDTDLFWPSISDMWKPQVNAYQWVC